MTQTGIYVRISSDPQGLRAGVDRQEADSRKECERRGWEVAGVYADNDQSAYSGKPRPAYQRLCADLEESKIGAVVAWAWDRLHRSPLELEAFVDLVNRTGAAVSLCMAGEVDLSTADGRFHARMLGTVARHESEKKSERVRRAKLQQAQEGRWGGGGRRPYGFEADGETVRTHEAEVLRAVVERVLAGEALSTIAGTLTAAGVPTSEGGRWTHTILRQILTNPRLVGQRAHKGALYPARWAPLVSQREWDALSGMLATSGPMAGPSRTRLLTGLLTCGLCGKSLTSGTGPKSRPLYVCPTRRAGGCGGVSIDATHLDKYVRAEVKDHGHGRKAPAGQLAKIQAHLRVLEERIDALDHAHMVEGKFSDGKYAQMRAALEEKLRAGQGALSLPPPAAVTASDETLEGKRQRIGAALERITILPAQRKGGRGLEESRVDFKWRPKA